MVAPRGPAGPVSREAAAPIEPPAGPGSAARRSRVLAGLVVAIVVLAVAAVWCGSRGGWWGIAAVGLAGVAVLLVVAAVVYGRRVPAPAALRSGVDKVNAAAEQAVRRTGGGGAGGMGSGVAGTPALYRSSQPWDDGTLPEPVNGVARGNRAQRRGSARAAQRRDAAISEREREARRRALADARRRTGNGPGPRGR